MDSEYYFDERHQADYDSGIQYYLEQHDPDVLDENYWCGDFDVRDAIVGKYCKEHCTEISDIALSGLIEMINDDVIKSPAFVAWERIPCFIGFKIDTYSEMVLDDWIELIKEPQKRVELLNYWIQSADLLYKYDKKEAVTHLKAMLPKYKEAAKIRKQELDKEKAAQRKQTAKEKPEYVLSLDEIIEYVKTKSPESAPAIRAMLYDMMLHKEGWNKLSTLKKIDSMDVKIVHQGDNIYGNKIGNNIESVSANGIGVQEIHE